MFRAQDVLQSRVPRSEIGERSRKKSEDSQLTALCGFYTDFFLAVCTGAHIGHRSILSQRVSASRPYVLSHPHSSPNGWSWRKKREEAVHIIGSSLQGQLLPHRVSGGHIRQRTTEKKPEPRIMQLLRAPGTRYWTLRTSISLALFIVADFHCNTRGKSRGFKLEHPIFGEPFCPRGPSQIAVAASAMALDCKSDLTGPFDA